VVWTLTDSSQVVDTIRVEAPVQGWTGVESLFTVPENLDGALVKLRFSGDGPGSGSGLIRPDKGIHADFDNISLRKAVGPGSE